MPGKILVVDDEPGFVELLTELLTTSGYSVTSAGNGRQAIACVNNDLPDLMILDIKMPTMDGYEVCRLLRDDKRFMKIPVIMLTAMDELEDIKKGMSLGAVSYISKPFERNMLLAMIQGLVGPGEASSGESPEAKEESKSKEDKMSRKSKKSRKDAS